MKPGAESTTVFVVEEGDAPSNLGKTTTQGKSIATTRLHRPPVRATSTEGADFKGGRSCHVGANGARPTQQLNTRGSMPEVG